MSKYKSRMHRQDTEVSEYKVELAEVSITSCELSEEGIGFHVLSMKFTQLIFNWGCIDIHLISSADQRTKSQRLIKWSCVTWQVKRLTWLNEEWLRRDSDRLGGFAVTVHEKEDEYKSEEQWKMRVLL